MALRRLEEDEDSEEEAEAKESKPIVEKKRRYTELQKMLGSGAVGLTGQPQAAPAPVVDDGKTEVVDLDSVGYMALKRLVIAKGVPKVEASTVPGKAHLKELAIKYGCAIQFTDRRSV